MKGFTDCDECGAPLYTHAERVSGVCEWCDANYRSATLDYDEDDAGDERYQAELDGD